MKHQRLTDTLILAAAAVLAVVSVAFIGGLRIDSSVEVFVPADRQVVLDTRRVEAQFGSSDALLVGIKADQGTVIDVRILKVVAELTAGFERLDDVKTVISISNSDHMQAGVEGMEAVPLYDPDEPEALQRLIERLADWPEVYDGTLISADRGLAAIVIQPTANLGGEGQQQLYEAVSEILTQQAGSGYSFALAGFPVVKQQINRSLLKDLAILGPVVGLLVVLVLFFSFRRMAGIVLPIAGLLLCASVTVGIMVLLGITFTMATMLIPVLLLVVGSAYFIHILSHFYEETQLAGFVVGQRLNAIIHMVVKRNFKPIFMSAATTFAGFISLVSSPLGPFRSFGILSAVGVALSFAAAIWLLPSMLRLWYRKGIKPASQRRRQRDDGLYGSMARFVFKGRKWLLAFSVVTAVALTLMVPRIENGTNMLEFFTDKSPMVRDTTLFNDKMNGSGIISLHLEGPETSAVLDPAFLESLLAFQADLETLEGVGKVQSIATYLKRMNLIMQDGQQPYRQSIEQEDFDFFGDLFGAADSPAETETVVLDSWDPATWDEIPADPAKYGLQSTEDLRNLMSQYLLLYAGNLDTLINDDLEPSATLVTIQSRRTDNAFLRSAHQRINDYWALNLSPDWKMTICGGNAITLELDMLVSRSQIISMFTALVVVWLMVTAMFRSPQAGVLALSPVLFALAGIFTFMGLLQIKLNIITSLLASLAIGMGVDYAIHLLAGYQRESQLKSPEQAMDYVMRTSGKAILVNALSIVIGFAGLIVSQFIPIRHMGILFCIAMTLAGFSALTILPAMITFRRPGFLDRPITPRRKTT